MKEQLDVKTIIFEVFEKITGEAINNENVLIENMALNSIQYIEFIVEIEEEFLIEFKEEKMLKSSFKYLSELIRYVEMSIVQKIK